MDTLDEDPGFQELYGRVLERLHAGLEVDVDGMGVENSAHREALRHVVTNWRAIHASPMGDSRNARARNLLHTHPEFDGYRLTGILGEGGCSVVFRAQDVGALQAMGEDVADYTHAAIKVFTGGISHSTLKKEFASLKSLSKARCVPDIYKYGEVEGFPYLAMQLIEGNPLVSLLALGKELGPPKRCRALVITICRALAEVADHVSATECGLELVHGDIKPQNIIILDGDEVKLLDFSVAMLRRSGPRTLGENTLSSAIGYTPHFASPEMLIGNDPADRITPASDIFQLGLVAFRMMTGRDYWLVPSQERPALLSRHPDSHLAGVVARAVSWEPARRFPSASKMHEALCPKPPPGPMIRILRSRIFRALAVTMVVAIMFGFGWLVHSWQSDARKAEVETKLQESRGQLASSQAEVANLRERLRLSIGQSPGTYEQRLTNIRVRYDNVKKGTAAEDDLARLEDDCRGFVKEFPGDVMTPGVRAVEAWIRDARTKGVIRVEPIEFKENAYWDTATMHYRIGLRGVPWDDTKRIVAYVETVDHTADLTGKRFFETTWRPGKRIDVQITAWGKEGVDHFPLDGDGEILKSEEDVIEKSLRTSGDDDFTFRFRIKRIGFGRMPGRP
ncbi:MAG: serine/threonine-protein kinase [Planctomycetota bacterium]|nr:serine/threonine-protein kinase [Planctomycetota bacterium]